MEQKGARKKAGQPCREWTIMMRSPEITSPEGSIYRVARAGREAACLVRAHLSGEHHEGPHRTIEIRPPATRPSIRRNPFVTTLDSETDALILAMPKAELHVHLEGSVRPATLLTLARRHGVDLGCNNEAELRELYRFRDF